MSFNMNYVLARVAELRGDAGEVPMDSQPSKKRRVETPESIDTPMYGDASEADDLEDGGVSGEVSESASQEDTDGDTDADESVSTGPQKNSAEQRAEIFGLLGVSDDSLSYGDALLSLSRPYKEDDRALRSFLAQPVEQVQSLVPLDAFMQKDDDEWDTHCLKVDQEWSKLVEQLGKLQPSIKLEELSKPSGPLGAPVCCMWHYPTYHAAKSVGGHTLDPKNPSLRTQVTKLGLSPSMLTLDRIPIRKDSKDKEFVDLYDNFEKIEEACTASAMALAKQSKFLIVVGRPNFFSVRGWLQRDSSVNTVDVPLRIPFNIYARPAHCVLVKDKATGAIRQVVVFAYHAEHFMKGAYKKTGAYCDLVWNAVAEWSDIVIRNQGYFWWRAADNKPHPEAKPRVAKPLVAKPRVAKPRVAKPRVAKPFPLVAKPRVRERRRVYQFKPAKKDPLASKNTTFYHRKVDLKRLRGTLRSIRSRKNPSNRESQIKELESEIAQLVEEGKQMRKLELGARYSALRMVTAHREFEASGCVCEPRGETCPHIGPLVEHWLSEAEASHGWPLAM